MEATGVASEALEDKEALEEEEEEEEGAEEMVATAEDKEEEDSGALAAAPAAETAWQHMDREPPVVTGHPEAKSSSAL